jgi:hypothetical protein
MGRGPTASGSGRLEMQVRAGRKPRCCGSRQRGFAPVTLARFLMRRQGGSSAAVTLSGRRAFAKLRAAFCCGNIEPVLYILVDGNGPAQRVSMSRRQRGPGEKERGYRPRRIECRPGREDFFIWIRHNPLKSPESAEEIQGNASFFPWIPLDFLAFILPAARQGSRRRIDATAGPASLGGSRPLRRDRP